MSYDGILVSAINIECFDIYKLPASPAVAAQQLPPHPDGSFKNN
jgi:hypothetical protein